MSQLSSYSITKLQTGKLQQRADGQIYGTIKLANGAEKK